MNFLAYQCVFKRPSLTDAHQDLSFSRSLKRANANDLKYQRFSVYNGNNILCRIYYLFQRYLGQDSLITCRGELGDFYVERGEYTKALLLSHYQFTEESEIISDQLYATIDRVDLRWREVEKGLNIISKATKGDATAFGVEVIHESVMGQLPNWFARTDCWEPIDFRREASLLEWNTTVVDGAEDFDELSEKYSSDLRARLDLVFVGSFNKMSEDLEASIEKAKAFALDVEKEVLGRGKNLISTFGHAVRPSSFVVSPITKDRMQQLFDGVDLLKGINAEIPGEAFEAPIEAYEAILTLVDNAFKRRWNFRSTRTTDGLTEAQMLEQTKALRESFVRQAPITTIEEYKDYVAGFFSDEMDLSSIENETLRAGVKELVRAISSELQRNGGVAPALINVRKEKARLKDEYTANRERAIAFSKELAALKEQLQSYEDYMKSIAAVVYKSEVFCNSRGVILNSPRIIPNTYIKDTPELEADQRLDMHIVDIHIDELDSLAKLKNEAINLQMELANRFKSDIKAYQAIERLNPSSVRINGKALVSSDGSIANFSEDWMNGMWARLHEMKKAGVPEATDLQKALFAVALCSTLSDAVLRLEPRSLSPDEVKVIVLEEVMALLMIDVNPGAKIGFQHLTVSYLDAICMSRPENKRKFDIMIGRDTRTKNTNVAVDFTNVYSVVFQGQEKQFSVKTSLYRENQVAHNGYRSNYLGRILINPA